MASGLKSLPSSGRAYFYLGTLVAAYIGVYLCRKNLSVAVPELQTAWGLTKKQVGFIGSASTVTYAAGKFLFGPITDRLGGRTALLGSMMFVAIFSAAGGLVPSLTVLTIMYSANRLCGSASWGAMLKQIPDWFEPRKIPFTCGLLSLSYVFGGAIAVAFAGLIARLTHDSWHAVLSIPSLVLMLLAVASWFILPRSRGEKSLPGASQKESVYSVKRVLQLFTERKFLVVVALSFTLTLLRETFNFWTVDFIHTEAAKGISNSAAAMLSTPFDLCGGVGIVLMGLVFGRLQPRGRQILLVCILGLLSILLAVLPSLFHLGLWALAAGVGMIGFLVYGPYSLLAGVLSVEVRGQEFAATVSGMVDGTGYIAGFLSGVFFGQLLMIGGYRLGFEVMAGLTLVSAFLCLFLYGKPATSSTDHIPGPIPSAGESGPETHEH